MRNGGMMGRGCGFGRRGGNGCGRGWRNMFCASGRPGWMRLGAGVSGDLSLAADSVPAVARSSLKAREADLLAELKVVQARLVELKERTVQSKE